MMGMDLGPRTYQALSLTFLISTHFINLILFLGFILMLVGFQARIDLLSVFVSLSPQNSDFRSRANSKGQKINSLRRPSGEKPAETFTRHFGHQVYCKSCHLKNQWKKEQLTIHSFLFIRTSKFFLRLGCP